MRYSAGALRKAAGDLTGDDVATGAGYAAKGAEALGGSSRDAATLEGAASGASAGASVGGVWGAAIGAIIGAIAGGSGPPSWFDPKLIGPVAYWIIGTGMDRNVDPWDLGAGLVAGDLGSPGANLFREAFEKWPELRRFGNDPTFPDGFRMRDDVEAAVFMLSQLYGIMSVDRPLEQLALGLNAPQQFDLGDDGELNARARRTVLAILKGATPAKSPFSAATPASAALVNVRPIHLTRPGMVKAATATITPARRRVAAKPRQAPSTSLLIPIGLAIGAALVL